MRRPLPQRRHRLDWLWRLPAYYRISVVATGRGPPLMPGRPALSISARREAAGSGDRIGHRIRHRCLVRWRGMCRQPRLHHLQRYQIAVRVKPQPVVGRGFAVCRVGRRRHGLARVDRDRDTGEHQVARNVRPSTASPPSGVFSATRCRSATGLIARPRSMHRVSACPIRRCMTAVEARPHDSGYPEPRAGRRYRGRARWPGRRLLMARR